MKTRTIPLCAVALVAGTAAAPLFAATFEFACDRPGGVYSLGEKATITVAAFETNKVPLASGKLKWRLNNFGDATLSEGTFDVSKGANTFSVSGTMNEPGFMRLDVADLDDHGKTGKTQFFGVAYDPYRISPGAECPADFSDFWAAAVKKYDETVTAPIKATKVDDDPSKERDLYELEIPTVDGRSIWGYLSEPKDLSKGPFPVVVKVPGAGPSTWGAEGDGNTIRMVVNVHYYRPLRGEAKRSKRNMANQKAEDEAWAKRYPVKHVRYTTTGIASSREEYFYYGVLLGINRAVDWLAARPEVDRRRFRYWGGSQGGGFGLWLCGLNRNFTRAVVGVPALTDLLGFRQGGRESGWPRLIESQLDENRAAAERNAPYFCGVNFARNIKIPIRVEVGSADTVCPPMAGFSAFNVMPSKDKDILIGLGQGHSMLPEISEKLDKWLREDTLDIQRQIDDVHAAGGGRVTVPAGRYEVGPIHLKSNVELHFEDGAELLFTDDIDAYLPPVETAKGGVECLAYSPLIYANGATNIAITGRGRIAPRMGLWECWRWTGEKTKAARNVLANVWGANDVPLRDRDITKLEESKSRPQFIGLRRCRNVRLEDFKMRHSPSWCVHLLECDGVEVRNIDIEAFLNNNDGIDIESSRNVLVEDCRFSVGDDIICLKSGKDRDGRRRGIPTENVVVRRCVADCGHAFFGIGSELSGGIRNAVMEDCVMEGTCAWLFRIKTTPTRGGFVENVAMRRVKAKNITASVLNITDGYGNSGALANASQPPVPPTRISGVTIEDVSVERAKFERQITLSDPAMLSGLSVTNLTVKYVESCRAKEWSGFARGMGIGGWLTNYKRFNVLPEDRRLQITQGDLEHFDSYITEADVKRIKEWGFDHIRLGFDQIVLEEAPGKYRERTFRKIDEFIGWCGRHKMNVVLNLHKAIGNYCDIKEEVELLDDDGLQRRFIDLWLEIERRYHDFPGLAFEILNEVRNVDPEKWNSLADRTLRAIREKNPSRWVVIGSTCWNSPGKLKNLKVWDDPKVVYTFHLYAPFEFTHQRGVLQHEPLYCNMVMEYPSDDVERYRLCKRLGWGDENAYQGFDAIDRKFLAHALRGALDFVKAHPDKILWNGEFGTIRHAPQASRIAYMRDVVSICKEAGIPWCVWNYLSTPNDGNRFSLVDDDTREFLSPELLRACLGE